MKSGVGRLVYMSPLVSAFAWEERAVESIFFVA
jgi:hypothetical protein